MKTYHYSTHIVFDHRSNDGTKFNEAVIAQLENIQNNQWMAEIQYSTCATQDTIVYSALILGYTED